MGKRRKVREHELEREGEGRRGELGDEEKEQGVLPGCGRVVCRGCSFETPERYVDVGLFAFVLWTDPRIFDCHCSDLNTCYDCVGRPVVQT